MAKVFPILLGSSWPAAQAEEQEVPFLKSLMLWPGLEPETSPYRSGYATIVPNLLSKICNRRLYFISKTLLLILKFSFLDQGFVPSISSSDSIPENVGINNNDFPVKETSR